MRIALAAIYLVLAGCQYGGTPFEAPPASEVSTITAQLYNRPDGGADIVRTEIPPSSHQQILGALDGAREDRRPMKWQVLGNISIVLNAGSVDVRLFWTGDELGAFRANGKYYRGSSDAELIELVSSAKNQQSGQGDALRPAAAEE